MPFFLMILLMCSSNLLPFLGLNLMGVFAKNSKHFYSNCSSSKSSNMVSKFYILVLSKLVFVQSIIDDLVIDSLVETYSFF